MSTKTWTETQLLAAYDVGVALVGWDFAQKRSTVVGSMLAQAIATATDASAATKLLPKRLFPVGDIEVEHFARRVREELGVDEPAWKKLEWKVSGSTGVSVHTADLGEYHFAVWEHPKDCCCYSTTRLLAVHVDALLFHFRGASLDICKAALHDALVKHLLATLRAAVPA